MLLGEHGAGEADQELVEPDERGDPMSPLRWTLKSLRTLAGELTRPGSRRQWRPGGDRVQVAVCHFPPGISKWNKTERHRRDPHPPGPATGIRTAPRPSSAPSRSAAARGARPTSDTALCRATDRPGCVSGLSGARR